MTAFGSLHRTAGARALPIAITALLLALALAPGCIIIGNAGGGGGDCINPFDDSCFNCVDCGAGDEGDPDADNDGDGISNEDELLCNLDPNSVDSDLDGTLDGDEDHDRDGYSTAEELEFGSECLDHDDFPPEPPSAVEDEDPPPPADADDDGLSDEDEAARGTDPNNADTDGDGQCDGAEVDCQSSPLDPSFVCT